MDEALKLAAVVVLLAGCQGAVGERTEWAYDVTQLEALAQEGKSGHGITIGILDTGIDVGHPALEHLVDGEGAELIAFRDYYGGVTGPANAFDDAGHGTHVAGIIGARSGGLGDRLIDGVALRGGAPGADLVVARVCGAETCRAQSIPDAISWAVDQGADVLSLSLGSNPSIPALLNDALADELELAINRAIARGVVVIASAGNDGNDAQDVAAPANIPDVIAVGAIDEGLSVAGFSQQGDPFQNQCRTEILGPVGRCRPNQKPEIVAPGVGILSSWVDGTYATAEGTSQATPFVAAAVALMLEDGPLPSGRAGVVEVKAAIVETAERVAGQSIPHDDAAGYGLLQASDARRALRA